jgi:HEAT repeat protein
LFAVFPYDRDRLARCDFGLPLEPPFDPERHLRWVLADFDARRDEQWRVQPPVGPITLLKILYEEKKNPRSRLIVPLLRAFGFYGTSADFARYEAHEYLRSDDPEVRLAAARAIGSFAGIDSVPVLKEHVGGADGALLRELAVALGKAGTLDDVEELEPLARGDAHIAGATSLARERFTALDQKQRKRFALVSIRSDDVCDDLVSLAPFLQEELLELLDDPTSGVAERCRIARVLGLARPQSRRLGKVGAALLRDAETPHPLTLALITMLGRIRSTLAVPTLCQLLDRGRQDVQEATIAALEEIGDARAFAPLLRHYDDHDGALRSMTRRAIWHLAEPVAEETYRAWGDGLLHFMSAGVYFIDDEARAGLLREACYPHLTHSQASVRRQALLLLGLFGDRRDVAELKRAGEQESDELNRDLARLGLQRAYDRLPPPV